MGHFEHRFQKKGASPTNHCWCQSSRVTAFSCGIKISAVHHLYLSQSTGVTDRQSDRWTDGRTDRQNYDSQDRPRICSRGKNYLSGALLIYLRDPSPLGFALPTQTFCCIAWPCFTSLTGKHFSRHVVDQTV